MNHLFTKGVPSKNYQKKFNKILIWSSMGIGNMVNFLPMLRALRKTYPESKITLLTWSNPIVYDLVEDGIYDKIIFLNKKSRFHLWLNTFYLFFSSYDLFIVKWHDNIWISRFIKALRSTFIIGHVSSAGWKSSYDYLIDHPVKLVLGKSDKEQYMNLICDLLPEKLEHEEYLKIPSFAKKKVNHLLEKHNLEKTSSLIGFHLDVGLAQPYKQIGFAKWLRVIRDIRKKLPEKKLIILGAANDTISNKIIEEFKDDDNVINMLGNLNIIETAALISNLNLLVGVDSSLKTIASALKIKSIVAYGCTDPVRAAPNGSNIEVIRLSLECSPCDVFGPTKWNSCDHHSCIKKLNFELIVQSIMSFHGVNEVDYM